MPQLSIVKTIKLQDSWYQPKTQTRPYLYFMVYTVPFRDRRYMSRRHKSITQPFAMRLFHHPLPQNNQKFNLVYLVDSL